MNIVTLRTFFSLLSIPMIQKLRSLKLKAVYAKTLLKKGSAHTVKNANSLTELMSWELIMMPIIHIRPNLAMHSSKRDTANTVTDATSFTRNVHSCQKKANGKRFTQQTEKFSKVSINLLKADFWNYSIE